MEFSTEQDTSTDNKKKNKHLIFHLTNEKYGMPLSAVKEVIGVPELTAIPQVPKYIRGLINLRGKIITIIDLKNKLGMGDSELIAKKTSIIITEINNLVIGCLVDEVSEVIGLKHDQIEQNITVNSKVSKEFITGVAKVNDNKLVLLLDIGQVLSDKELNIIRKQAQ